MNYSCVRTKKIRTVTDAQNATRHGRREKGSFRTSAVDLERTHLNGHWQFDPDTQELEPIDQGVDVWKALEDRRKALGAKRPKNGQAGTEMMFTASPGLFKDESGKVDIAQARAWGNACLEIAQDKYPGMCVGARLDLDETTPHISVFIMPVYEKEYSGEKRKSTRKPRKTVSHNKVFGGPDDLSRLQDWAADNLRDKGFDVQRGVPVEITRARNFRPDGVIYERMLQVYTRMRKRENWLKDREKVVSGWLRQVGEALAPVQHLLPAGLQPGVAHLTKRLEDKQIKATPGVDEQLQAADHSHRADRAARDRQEGPAEAETPQSPSEPAPPAPRF